MSTERFEGEWGRQYLGPQVYRCPTCGEAYEHDGAYRHAVFECPGVTRGDMNGP